MLELQKEITRTWLTVIQGPRICEHKKNKPWGFFSPNPTTKNLALNILFAHGAEGPRCRKLGLCPMV